MGVGEESAQTIISVTSKSAMLTAEMIFTLMRGTLNHMKTHNVRNIYASQNRTFQSAQNRAQAKSGKQSLGELTSKNLALDTIPVSNVDIKDMSARLKKLGVDFAVTKNRSTGEFNLFFKATDTAVIESAFQEIITDKDKNNRSDKVEEQGQDKKPINEQVKNAQDKADSHNKAKAAEKAKEQQKNRSGREQDR